MKKEFYLITWKEYENRKAIQKSEIALIDKAADALTKMMKHNASRRVTSTDYILINLSELFNKKHIKLDQESK